MPAYTTDALLAVASGSTDADNDPITYLYEWWQNGCCLDKRLPVSLIRVTTKNDVWTVRVTPNDGYGDGPYVESTLTMSTALQSSTQYPSTQPQSQPKAH